MISWRCWVFRGENESLPSHIIHHDLVRNSGCEILHHNLDGWNMLKSSKIMGENHRSSGAGFRQPSTTSPKRSPTNMRLVTTSDRRGPYERGWDNPPFLILRCGIHRMSSSIYWPSVQWLDSNMSLMAWLKSALTIGNGKSPNYQEQARDSPHRHPAKPHHLKQRWKNTMKNAARIWVRMVSRWSESYAWRFINPI